MKTIFLKTAGLIIFYCLSQVHASSGLPDEFTDPPHEFSIMPFWFWNDTLNEEEIIRQIGDFEDHGVYGFVIHPRIGLPENMKWLSPEMLHFMGDAIREAARRKMYVILYDEGMYPSGSSSGQVVESNPAFAARGLAKIYLKPGENPIIPSSSKLVTIIDMPDSGRVAVIDKPSGGVIRGLHYLGEETGHPEEETPPAADILNPDAADSFIKHVYDRFAVEFGSYFGTTILGIFTDEPSPLGRGGEKGMVPGSAALMEQINRILGYDFTPFLADLWYNDLPDAVSHRADYYNAINICLGENYYSRLSQWCRDHKISLMGHPAGSMDIGIEKYFGVPGQDLVWRYVEPGPKALKGEHSTMAKCASSAMVHLGLRRNSNELYGAYGHDLTMDEMQWLAGWCFLRGQNFLFPHAFYYSVRGPRLDERPPDVGPHAAWWGNFRPFADACRRLSWINTDSRQVCSVAILCESSWLPYRIASTCFRSQKDFNYLEMTQLIEDATIGENGVHISGMDYKVVIIDSLSSLPVRALGCLEKLAKSGRLIIRKDSPFKQYLKGAYLADSDYDVRKTLDRLIKADIVLDPSSDCIRYRHVIKNEDHYYIIFNEDSCEVSARISFPVGGKEEWLDPFTGSSVQRTPDEKVHLRPHELKILRIKPGQERF